MPSVDNLARAFLAVSQQLAEAEVVASSAGKTQHEGYIAFLKIKDILTREGQP